MPPTTTPPTTSGPASSSLTLAGPATSPVGQPATLAGTLAYGDGTAVPAGTTLTVSGTGPAGAIAATTQATGAGGTFADTVAPTAVGSFTYTVSYAGDSSHGPASASFTVSVVKRATTLSLAASRSTVSYGSKVTVTATLGATHTSRKVAFYAQVRGSRTITPIGTVTASSTGIATLSYTLIHSTYFSAAFAGDDWDAAVTVRTSAVSVPARITQALSGYYGSTTIAGTPYRVYHHTATLTDTLTVAPNKSGQIFYVEVSLFFQGSWVPDLQLGPGALTRASQGTGRLNLSHASGDYRIQVIYDNVFPASAGKRPDLSNLPSTSSWLYFQVRP